MLLNCNAVGGGGNPPITHSGKKDKICALEIGAKTWIFHVSLNEQNITNLNLLLEQYNFIYVLHILIYWYITYIPDLFYS